MKNKKNSMFDKGYIFYDNYKGIDIYFYYMGCYTIYAIYDNKRKKFIEQDIISALSCKQKITKYLKQK